MIIGVYRRRLVALVLTFGMLFVMLCGCKKNEETDAVKKQERISAHTIENVPVYVQQELPAGCEVYAGIVTLQYLGFDIDEHEFSEKYLIQSPISYDYLERYGPDMNSAYAGTVTNGYGIYSPAMAKSMNRYLETTNSKKRAKVVKGETLDSLCQKYVAKDIPVMVWATTYMHEPYVKAEWIVDYVDENADTELGGIEQWMQNEHCLVLMGFDEEYYYFADSVSGAVTSYEKEVSELRFEQLGSQAIVVK